MYANPVGHARAFVQFESLDTAAAFVKEHFPRVFVKLPQSTDDAPDGMFEAYLHYARNRDEVEPRGVPGPNWTCPHVSATCGTRP